MPAAKLFGEPSRLIQMYSIANMRIYFGMAKEKAETFYGSAFSISIMLIIEHSKRTTKDIYLLSWGDKKNSFS